MDGEHIVRGDPGVVCDCPCVAETHPAIVPAVVMGGLAVVATHPAIVETLSSHCSRLPSHCRNQIQPLEWPTQVL